MTTSAPRHKPLAPHVQREVDAVQEAVEAQLDTSGPLTVMEAGCGSLTRLRFGPRAHVVGVDISQKQLDDHPALDERILGDLENYDFEPSRYDAVVCWYVFEHLARPDRALVNFSRAVRPGGLIVIAVPNVRSPKVLLTKFTPHAFHVWVYRRVFGRPHAGEAGYAPFPTTIPLSIVPERLVQLAQDSGLEVVTTRHWEDPKQVRLRTRIRLTGRAWDAIARTVRIISFRQLDASRTENCFVFRRTTTS